MLQTLMAYAMVAAASAWIAWSFFLKSWFKARAPARASKGCGGDCNCH